MSAWFQELKRRNVIRVGSVYIVVAWLLIQVASVLENALKLPGWFDGMVSALILLGFPIALIFAWAFELTPDGVRLTTTSDQPTPRAATVDYLLLLALLSVGGLIVFDRFVSPQPTTTAVAAVAPAKVPSGPPSIAVLPFVDLSPNQDQAYFSDGLAEEILNLLTRVSNLQVAGRTSSFAYKGKNLDLRDIARSLNVTHVLEGSVRRAGQKIRVTAQLINASDGFHIFSETYDRKLDDVFSLQDDISARIAKALEIRLVKTARNVAGNGEAFDLYLRARDHLSSRQVSRLYEAERLLNEAVALAPEYAPVYAALALTNILLSNAPGSYGERPIAEVLPKAKALIDKALALEPTLAEGHAVLGLYMSMAGADKEKTVAALKRALALNPKLSDAKLWLASELNGPESISMLESIVQYDPGYFAAVQGLAQHYANSFEHDRAYALLDRAERIPGLRKKINSIRGAIAFQQGNLTTAYRALSTANKDTPSDRLVKEMLGWLLINLGETERAIALEAKGSKMYGLALLGRVDETLKLIEENRENKQLEGIIISVLTLIGHYKEAIHLVETKDGQLDHARLALLERFSFGALIDLVVAYRKLESPQKAQVVLDRLAAVIQKGRTLGYGRSPQNTVVVAQYEALSGRNDEALRLVNLAIERGLNGVNMVSPALSLTGLDQTPGYKAALRKLSDQVNLAREELGWGPLEPQTNL
ncbi:MAG: hypothetical protein AAFN74_00605 [Myxococcota bacterium]